MMEGWGDAHSVPAQCGGPRGAPGCWEEKAAGSGGLESARETGPSCIMTASSFIAAEAFVNMPSKPFQFSGKDRRLLGDGFPGVPQEPPQPQKSWSVHSLSMNLKIPSGPVHVPQMVLRPCLGAQRAMDRFISEKQTTECGADINWMKYLDCTQAKEKAHLPLETEAPQGLKGKGCSQLSGEPWGIKITAPWSCLPFTWARVLGGDGARGAYWSASPGAWKQTEPAH